MGPGLVKLPDFFGSNGIDGLPILPGGENDQWAISLPPHRPPDRVRPKGAVFRCRASLSCLRLNCFDSLIAHSLFGGALL
jgi:hypothetical protein